MFEFDIIQSDHGDSLKLQHMQMELEAIFVLDQGASLQSLQLHGKQVIKIPHNWSYTDCYASAILFPFANRVQDGAYDFDGTTYQLDRNEMTTGNAIHGLLADKRLELARAEMGSDSALLTFEFESKNLHPGFPFDFKFTLSYLFSLNSLRVSFGVLNRGDKSFPCSLGWHPYFNMDYAEKQTLGFQYFGQAEINDTGITQKMHMHQAKSAFNWDAVVDDCFLLNDELVQWRLQGFDFQLKSSGLDYLQVFSVPEKDFIAIEPVTAPSDSFNNGIGLKVLESKASFNSFCELSWT